MNDYPNLDPTDPAPPPPPPPPPRVEAVPALPLRVPAENPVFNFGDVLLILIVVIGSLVFCTFVTLAIWSTRHPFRGDVKELAENILLFLPAQLAAYIMTVGFMAFLIWQKYRVKLLDAVRWNPPPAAFAYLTFAGGAGLGLATQLLAWPLDRWVPKNLPIEQYFRTPAAAYALAAFGILVAPAVEELFFRGFLYPVLARPLGAIVAMVLTSIGFALIHAEQLALAWVPLLLLFTVSMVLTTVRARTKSVAICVLLHMGYNFAQFASAFIETHGFRHMERG